MVFYDSNLKKLTKTSVISIYNKKDKGREDARKKEVKRKREKITSNWTGVLAQGSRALVSLVEDPGLIQSTHMAL